MAAKIACSVIALLLAAGGFFDTMPANPLDPVGILFLTLAGIIWFGWELIREAYAYHRDTVSSGDRSDLMLYRLAPMLTFKLGRNKIT